MTSKSRRPYLIRAIYQWAVDNGLTPHILVAADYPGVVVPREHVHDGLIRLNIGPMAVQTLNLDIEPIWFSARFAGRAFEVSVPSGAVLQIHAAETNEGFNFGEIEPPQPAGETPPEPPAPPKPQGGRPKLRVVK